MLSPSPLVISAIGTALISIPTLFAAVNALRSLKVPSQALSRYEDKDGVASAESQRQFLSSKKLPAFLLLVSLVASSLSLVLAILGSRWLLFASHVLASLQCLNVFLEKRPVRKYDYAFSTAASYAILVITMFLVRGSVETALDRGLYYTDFVAAAAVFLTCLSFPRRPDVFYQGRLVDREKTISAIGRITYSWCSNLIALAWAKGVLEMEDLPSLDHNARSRDLHDRHPQLKADQSLIGLVAKTHAHSLMLHYIYTLLQAIFLIAPQLALYKLLKALEDRQAGDENAPVYTWVVAIGLTMLILNFVDGWMWFVSFTRLMVPIRVQLSALIFSKAMRRKDVKGQADKAVDSPEDSAEDDDEEAENKTRQGTINLIGIDTQRVSNFSIVQNWFVGATLKLVFAFGFLTTLIGWQAVLAGLVVQIATIPLNIHFSKKYTNAENHLMKARDKKLAVVNEVLSGIRHIKFAAFEARVQQQIKAAREIELDFQWQAMAADTILIFCWIAGPVMLSAACLTVYALIHGSLAPSIAFTTLGVLSSIMATLAYLPELTTNLLDAWVSLKRIEKYLKAPEKTEYATSGDSIEFRNASIAWPSDDEESERSFVIRNVNVKFPKNELSVISGQTGSGKSLFLAAIIGEADLVSGQFIIPKTDTDKLRDAKLTESNWIVSSSIAFVSQQPWIENATFRDNVLFGLPFNRSRYESVLSACSLGQDRTNLSDGDDTEIGTNGINLSGGQKWRITLARALYSRAGILIMDDIFSAVDAHVGRHIFENAICGKLCSGRTTILATHHVSLVLPKAKYTVHLSNGSVESAGSVALMERTGQMQEILRAEDEAAMSETEDIVPLAPIRTNDSQRSQGIHVSSSNENSLGASHLRPRRASVLSQFSEVESGLPEDPTQDIAKVISKNEVRKFVEDEKKESGRVAFRVYGKYLGAAGSVWFWGSVILLYSVYEVLLLGRSWWVTIWTQSYGTEARSASAHFFQQSAVLNGVFAAIQKVEVDPNLRFYLTGYIVISLFMCVLGALRYYFIFRGAIRGSRVLFDRLTYAVLRAPLRWLDTVPLGRILNRFTSDFNVIDSDLGNCTGSTLYNALLVVGIIIAGMVVSPWMMVFASVLLIICTRIGLYYLEAARETKRLESNAKSPIFEIFGVALSGVGTLRAFKKTETYMNNMFAKVDGHGSTLYYMWVLNRWITCRLGIIGSTFGLVTAGVLSSIKDFSPALAGFALSFALQYSDAIFWMLRQYATVEMAMNSTERIIEYSEIEIEKQDGASPPAAWPSQGRVDVTDLVISYAPDLPPVLKGISFNVEPGERCAVVGRTGAGKSSFTLALFRFLEASTGRIDIDGLNIANLKLHDLRSRLAIIPQDPVLFSGTVRTNLDPFDEYDDFELLETLKRVRLIESDAPNSSGEPSVSTTPTSANVNPFSSLNHAISEGGQNLSQGQRQLLCLARAIISRPKILVLDEATSAVDKTTDELIQRSIREQFKNSTLIVIAHRLSTIADFDRVLVLGDGKVLEYDKPSVLVEKEGGAFWGLVERSGEKDAVKEKIRGAAEA